MPASIEQWWMRLFFIVAGGYLGGLASFESALLGAALGYLFHRTLVAERRHQTLADQVDRLEKSLGGQIAPEAAPVATPVTPETPAPESLDLMPEVPAPMGTAPEVMAQQEAPAFATPPPIPLPVERAAPAEAPILVSGAPDSGPLDPGPFEKVRAFVLGGNTIARVGLLILFVGLGFFVKFAIDNDLFPIELRLGATALAGVALTGLGWRLRRREGDYGLILQGGGIAVFYLTIFAAYRLYDLLPASVAFGLLVATALLGGALAILQDAESLAVESVLGGFLAPVLASTGEGSHVALFTYYAVLSSGIFGIAWFKAWRVLNLTGYACTFGLATFWGGLRYRPALFASTEPFLILFFLQYLGISILQGRRRGGTPARVVDSVLVFGLPLVAFSLQAILVEPFAYGLAWSAMGLALLYAVVAALLFRTETARWLPESFAGLALAFFTMALPFAFDGTWTSVGWALEGVVLVWVGWRQQRLLLRVSGLLLQVAAYVSFVEVVEQVPRILPYLNRFFLGSLALSLAALATAYLTARQEEGVQKAERRAGVFFLTAGLFWWLFGGLGEVSRLTYYLYDAGLSLAFTALTALGCVLAGTALGWPGLRKAALWLLPGVFIFLVGWFDAGHPFADVGWAAWGLALAIIYYALWRNEGAAAPRWLRGLHAAGLWLLAILSAWELAWVLDRLSPDGSVWPALAAGMAPLLLIFATARFSTTERWPMGAHRAAYLIRGLLPLLAWVLGWSIYMSLESVADPSPLPYVPLLNPLDLVLGFSLVVGVFWQRIAWRAEGDGQDVVGQALRWLLVATIFLWLNASLARTCHFWAGEPFQLDDLLASTVFQASLSIFWTVLAVTTMVIAARRGHRTAWIVAAVLVGVVVVKLFLIDLSSLSTGSRIISFIGVGLLLLLVGYIAPAPPARAEPEAQPVDEPAVPL